MAQVETHPGRPQPTLLPVVANHDYGAGAPGLIDVRANLPVVAVTTSSRGVHIKNFP